MSRTVPARSQPLRVQIEDLSHDGRGVGHCDGKVVFVTGALPGEAVDCHITAHKPRHDDADLVHVVTPAAERCLPQCPHVAHCGGCTLQHLDAEAQRAFKQRQLGAVMQRIGRITPRAWLEPVTSTAYGYRARARLAARHDATSKRTTLGFRQRGSTRIATLDCCPVLVPALQRLLPPLQDLVAPFPAQTGLRTVHLALDEGKAGAGLAFEVQQLPATSELARIEAFCAAQATRAWVLNSADNAVLWQSADATPLQYHIDAGAITLDFLPWQFTQANREVNASLVARVLELLAPTPDGQFLDLFCGIGNFTLPLARRARIVTGVESSAAALEGARANAQRNRIANADFALADIDAASPYAAWLRTRVDGVLLDPPRAGAAAILPRIATLAPPRIVYVSCDPATLARDAGELVNRHGYRLQRLGLLDMFPQTPHFESIALFTRGR